MVPPGHGCAPTADGEIAVPGRAEQPLLAPRPGPAYVGSIYLLGPRAGGGQVLTMILADPKAVAAARTI
jgi:hypothetical protein